MIPLIVASTQIPPSCPQFPSVNGPGVLCEDFDTNRHSPGGFQWSRLPLGTDPNDPLRALGDPNDDVLGYTQSTGPAPLGTGGQQCLDDARHNQPTCSMPVAEENDWHLHSPTEGPGAGYDLPNRPGIGAPDGGKAHSGTRSMHWGRHLDPTHTFGDTTRYRQVSAFVLDPPVNLGPASTVEFWHMIQELDDDSFGVIDPGESFGGGQLQLSLLGSDGKFDRWRTLTPSFNGYNSTVQEKVTICQFDPGDDQLGPSDETMCNHSPMWSDIGDIFGTDATCTVDTDGNDPDQKDCGEISSCIGGPGCTENGSIGTGVWARSAFDLSPFAGRQARLRWIGSNGGGWSFSTSRSLIEINSGPPIQYYDEDDGWWIDDIKITDLRETPEPCTTDADQDGVTICQTDCNDASVQVWSTPGEVRDLVFSADGHTLTWSPPLAPGGMALVYDTIRSTSRLNFTKSATCVESADGSDTSASDLQGPLVNRAFYYLVRARNACPNGQGTLGTTSAGSENVGRACP